MLPPAGTFVPGPDADFLLLAGGSGITPVLSILKTALHAGAGLVTLVYANRDEASVIFRDELVALASGVSERLVGRALVGVGAGAADRARAPAAAGAVRRSRGLRLRPRPLHGPGRAHADRARLRARPGASGGVHLAGGRPVRRGRRGAAGRRRRSRRRGGRRARRRRSPRMPGPRAPSCSTCCSRPAVQAPFSCREGACSACACVLQEGTVDLEHNEVLDDGDLADGHHPVLPGAGHLAGRARSPTTPESVGLPVTGSTRSGRRPR